MIIRPGSALALILLGLSAVDARGREEPVTVAEAHRMIDAGCRAFRLHLAWTAVAHQSQGQGMVVVKEQVRNQPGAGRQVRVERRSGDATSVFLANERGFWLLKDGRAQRIAKVPETWQTIPLRLPVDDPRNATFTRSTDADWYGLNTLRLRGTWPAGEPVNEPGGRERPARYDYFLDPASGALLGWRASSATGKTLREAGYQEFRLGEVPAEIFELPAGAATVADMPQGS